MGGNNGALQEGSSEEPFWRISTLSPSRHPYLSPQEPSEGEALLHCPPCAGNRAAPEDRGPRIGRVSFGPRRNAVVVDLGIVRAAVVDHRRVHVERVESADPEAQQAWSRPRIIRGVVSIKCRAAGRVMTYPTEPPSEYRTRPAE